MIAAKGSVKKGCIALTTGAASAKSLPNGTAAARVVNVRMAQRGKIMTVCRFNPKQHLPAHRRVALGKHRFAIQVPVFAKPARAIRNAEKATIAKPTAAALLAAAQRRLGIPRQKHAKLAMMFMDKKNQNGVGVVQSGILKQACVRPSTAKQMLIVIKVAGVAIIAT